MGSDIARISFDKTRKYDSVVMQQGRVFVEADWNEQQAIAQSELRADVLDIVGPAGTPNDGYIIGFPAPATTPFDFTIAGGTMYVGGIRVDTAPTTYFTQPDWIDPPTPSSPVSEYIVLHLTEQDVSAVEDQQLKDVALGGPDTSQRRRIIQHIKRYPTTGTDCATALAGQEAVWSQEGLTFNPSTMMLTSGAGLEVSFGPPGSTDPCSPGGQGGYIDPDNQMIRVKIIGPDKKGSNRIIWSYDNASFLYRVDVTNSQTLTLKAQPVDAAHYPVTGQAVEVLYTKVDFGDSTDYIADANGIVTTLSSNYDPNLKQVTLADAIDFPPPRTPVFLRVWNSISIFTPGTPVELGNTGVYVTLSSPPFMPGTYWTFAVRPITPQTVYPPRFLGAAQPPAGPREWICPLAVLSWTRTTGTLVDNCVITFPSLVNLPAQTSSGCCTITVQPSDLTGKTTLQSIINKLQSKSQHVTVCLLPGNYILEEPLLLETEHSNLTLEGCGGGVILGPAKGAEGNFINGLIVIAGASNVTICSIELEMPVVPFNQFGTLNTGAAGASTFDAQLLTLDASIAIRTLGATNLTVCNCAFEYRVNGERDLFAVGILLSGDCTGLSIKSNQFESGNFLSSSDKPVRVLVGIMLVPVTVPITITGTRGAKSTTNHVLRGIITDSSITANQFSALTAGMLSIADTGSLQIENNQVVSGYSGFWIFSTVGLATLEVFATGDATGAITEAPNQINLARNLVNDTVIQYGASIARSYQLPKQFTPASTDLVGTTKAVTASELARLRLKTFNSTVAQLVTPVAAAPAPGAGQSKAGSNQTPSGSTPGSAAPVPDSGQSKAGSNQASSGSTPGSAAAASSVECPPSPVDLNTFPLFNDVSATQQGILLQGYKPRIANMALAINGNTVSVVPVSSASSSMALFVYDTPSDAAGSLIMAANKLENNAASLPTVLLGFVNICAVTGNLILNDANEPRLSLSLVIIESQDESGTGAAITGNVFRGPDILPARPGGFPSPLDDWNTFNTQLNP